jgi:YegS C-terminal NAD kinase beta sandwich-like domain
VTVEKGVPWGTPGPLPEGAVLVRSDGEAREVLEEARRRREDFPTIGLLGGDLCRTLGGRGDESRLRGDSVTLATVDIGEVLLDGRVRFFVAHAVARGSSWWRGELLAAMNAQYLGRWDVAPKAHPGDGLLDVLEVGAGFGAGDRWKAWRRLPSGTHVPHPGIAVRRVPAVQVDVTGRRVWLDGMRQDPADALSIRLRPDALHVAV